MHIGLFLLGHSGHAMGLEQHRPHSGSPRLNLLQTQINGRSAAVVVQLPFVFVAHGFGEIGHLAALDFGRVQRCRLA
jgi:hypothetical protein